MRILGLVLLLVGYSWLVWDQASVGPLVRVAVERSFATEVPIHRTMGLTPLASLPDTAYSLRNDEVKGFPVVGVRELAGLLPNFMWSGTTMLLGGLVLARGSGRRKDRNSNDKEPTRS